VDEPLKKREKSKASQVEAKKCKQGLLRTCGQRLLMQIKEMVSGKTGQFLAISSPKKKLIDAIEKCL
jgi:hypothetical protein